MIDYFRLQNNEEILNKAPKLYISGCLNSCGVHQVGSIGLWTDSGVHAIGQIANFKINSGISIESIPMALNAKLPKDISVIEA
ncbi:hypothetical protein ACTPEM_23740, partial [Clostridioides difficile]